MTVLDGIDEAPVTSWFEANVRDATGPLAFELIAGGRSNLTFRVTDAAGHQFVLRRPPISHVLPTAHDMAREYRIIKALGPTAVPVPPALGLCDDPAVNGAPFYVMGYVDGHVLRDEATVERTFPPADRPALAKDLVRVLAALHAVDVDAVGLGDLGRRENYIARQLRRWYGQYQQSSATHGRSVPIIEELHDRLAAFIPLQGPATLVHGDYRLDNTMFGSDGRVSAVLDWELCTLGDPLADLGLLMVYWSEPGDRQHALLVSPTTAPGFPTRAEIIAAYAECSGRDVGALDYYIAFGYWKLACIIDGVFARYAAGAMGAERGGYEAFADQVQALGELAREAAARL